MRNSIRRNQNIGKKKGGRVYKKQNPLLQFAGSLASNDAYEMLANIQQDKNSS